MRILHTADWHMNSTLGRQNLSALIVQSLEKIAAYLEEFKVDVLVVAGDLFSERSRDEGMREAIAQIRRIFEPFVQRGGRIVAVAGNHDSPLRFETLRDALTLGGDSRFFLTSRPDFLLLPDARGDLFQFALLPYPTPANYLHGETFSSLEEKNRKVQTRFLEALNHISDTQINPKLPAILVSHVHVRGAQTHSLFQISESDDVTFDPASISTDFAYAAYGHIHKPGAIAGHEFIRYCGSPVPLDAAERFDKKSVVLLEIGPRGERDIQILPLPQVSMHQITLDFTQNEPEAELAKWRALIPDAQTALVHYTVRYQPQKHALGALRNAIDATFPRWYNRADEKVGLEIAPRPLELVAGENAVSSAASANPLSGDVPSLVRSYLQQRLENNDDRDAVLGLAEELLATR
ncbi:Exodeoxyribonuclease I subunit D [Abditibacterium utsteinense]|uniref:Nuclease SbcCD subunit D n=1 Tax=Abditibacterium utsteinense TaxID=1960156 RepID=A0A2S8SRC2_9BACT|nr:exonuclease subunit SbcD [Abditibacterium utsteinense]PQV63326.1 Exodeoxyribonuclease I subunit D [Abditibacterium utsteinense]